MRKNGAGFGVVCRASSCGWLHSSERCQPTLCTHASIHAQQALTRKRSPQALLAMKEQGLANDALVLEDVLGGGGYGVVFKGGLPPPKAPGALCSRMTPAGMGMVWGGQVMHSS